MEQTSPTKMLIFQQLGFQQDAIPGLSPHLRIRVSYEGQDLKKAVKHGVIIRNCKYKVLHWDNVIPREDEYLENSIYLTVEELK